MSGEIDDDAYMQAYMDDCDRKIEAQAALIRELVAALDRIAKGDIYINDPAFTADSSAVIWAEFALAKAKAAGFALAERSEG